MIHLGTSGIKTKERQLESPSFNLLENRSTSFPHARAYQHSYGVDHDENRSSSHIGKKWQWKSEFNKPTAQGLTLLNTSPTRDDSPASHSRRKQQTLRHTPVLTLALIKLDENLERFCELLTEPTFNNVQLACEILDSSVATASISASEQFHRHPRIAQARISPSGSQKSSPSLSPIASWFVGMNPIRSKQTPPVSAAVALEGEWETFSNPLILFAGQEGIYASLSQAETSELGRNLSMLYERSVEDISLVREILCDPLIHSEDYENSPSSTTIPVKPSSTLPSYLDIARKVATSLDLIVNICRCRIELIAQQKILWSSTEIICMPDSAASFQSMLQRTKIPDSAHHAATILQCFLREVETFLYLIETALSIEQCRFIRTIVNAQNVKIRLVDDPKTCIHLWMVKTWQSLLSILPVVFSHTVSGANSLYGFNNSSLEGVSNKRLGSSDDIIAKISEFLKAEEKTRPFAVTLVLDSSRPGSRNASISVLERGFSIREEVSSKSSLGETAEFRSALSAFSPVFMCTSGPSSSTGLLGLRRNSARKEMSDLEETRVIDKEKSEQRSEHTTWPYSVWPLLAVLLSDGRKRYECNGIHWSQIDAETFVHASRVNESMWLVLATKSSDESRWHRRRTPAVIEDDVKAFLKEILELVRFSNIFNRAHVLEIRRCKVESGSTFSTESGDKMLVGRRQEGHADFVELLQAFKEELGLRSPRGRNPLDLSHGFRSRSGRILKSPGNFRRIGSSQSHHVFFLGHQLTNAL